MEESTVSIIAVITVSIVSMAHRKVFNNITQSPISVHTCCLTIISKTLEVILDVETLFLLATKSFSKEDELLISSVYLGASYKLLDTLSPSNAEILLPQMQQLHRL